MLERKLAKAEEFGMPKCVILGAYGGKVVDMREAHVKKERDETEKLAQGLSMEEFEGLYGDNRDDIEKTA